MILTIYIIYSKLKIMFNQQFLSFLFFFQIPSAIFVYMDAKRRNMKGFGLWVLGVAIFMPFFLPFYILLRPRLGTYYCPVCRYRNTFPIMKCKNCGLEIGQEINIKIRGEWNMADVIAIFALSIFTLPISLAGLSTILGFSQRDSASWLNIFYLNFISASLLFIMPLWFITKVCKRSLRDAGFKSNKIYRNIAIGVLVVLPVLFISYFAEEAIVRSIINIVPSKADAIHKLVADEHKRGGEIWPENSNEIWKILGSGFLLVVMAPLGEELLFRGMAYSALRKRSRRRALIFTSLLFTLAHLQIIHFVPVFLIGLVLAYLFEYTGSLVSSITLHSLINLTLMILWYYKPGIYS